MKPTRAREGRGSFSPLAPAGLLLAVAALASALAFASQRADRNSNPNFVPPAGQYASVDPRAEGWAEPSSEEAQQVRAAMQMQYGRTTPVIITRHPNGMLQAELPDDYMEVMVLKVNPDGTRSMQCVAGSEVAAMLAADAAEASQGQPAAPAPTCGRTAPEKE